jgi:lipoprotein-anchoring transpeptidase ErfK/SrfK
MLARLKIRLNAAGRFILLGAAALTAIPGFSAPLAAQEAPPRTDARPAHPARPSEVATVRVVSELAIDRWLRPGEFAWNDEGVTGGETVIVVNIRARVMSVYRGGIEIGRSSIIYGADNKPTPHGTFTILERRADHVSNLYDAPMPHMLRLTWDGVAIHGSPALADDLATRGCVGLPREFAQLLFSVTHVGDRVVIWSGEAAA